MLLYFSEEFAETFEAKKEDVDEPEIEEQEIKDSSIEEEPIKELDDEEQDAEESGKRKGTSKSISFSLFKISLHTTIACLSDAPIYVCICAS